ncbi:MAG: type II secretion system inner membrane protein GspF [Deltaproteobacteria bacterium]|nr:type II secretion system inner membrane protein GspF [Deltaproteobacteria bacterium]
MPVYEYTALDVRGNTLSGIVDADSPAGARQKLRAAGNYPVAVTEAVSLSVQQSTLFFKRFRRVRHSELAIMTRQLGTLMTAGFPLVAALDALIPQTRSPLLKNQLTRIKDAIVGGSSFSQALSTDSNTFSPLYINMIQAGESSGTMELVLDRLAEMIEKQQQVTQRITSAMTYPVFMTLIGAGILLFLITYIVPTIAALFADMKQVLPAPTRILIAASQILKLWWWVFPIAIAFFILSFQRLRNTISGRHAIDRGMLSLPVMGEFLRKLSAARLARTLGLLLENGVSLLSALEIVKNIAGNVIIADAVEAAANKVRQGQGLAGSLDATRQFPSLFIQMIQVGEQSGALESMLKKVADLFENEVESALMRMASLLEPVMILIMGVMVGFIVLSICLPIFEMNQLIR